MNWIYRPISGSALQHSLRAGKPAQINSKKLLEIANLEVDCKIGKARHLIAADRKNKWRIYLGLFAVIGSAFISSGIGQGALELGRAYLGQNMHYDAWAGTLKHILPLLVGVSTAVIGFLGLEKQTTQHRAVGNAYIEIARKARSILNSIDAHNCATKLAEYDRLLERYLEVNKEGESCPTNDRDSQKALNRNSNRRSAIKQRIDDNEKAHLGIASRRVSPRPSLGTLVARAVRIRVATVCTMLGLVRKSDYRKYLRHQQ